MYKEAIKLLQRQDNAKRIDFDTVLENLRQDMDLVSAHTTDVTYILHEVNISYLMSKGWGYNDAYDCAFPSPNLLAWYDQFESSFKSEVEYCELYYKLHDIIKVQIVSQRLIALDDCATEL